MDTATSCCSSRFSGERSRRARVEADHAFCETLPAPFDRPDFPPGCISSSTAIRRSDQPGFVPNAPARRRPCCAARGLRGSRRDRNRRFFLCRRASSGPRCVPRPAALRPVDGPVGRVSRPRPPIQRGSRARHRGTTAAARNPYEHQQTVRPEQKRRARKTEDRRSSAPEVAKVHESRAGVRRFFQEATGFTMQDRPRGPSDPRGKRAGAVAASRRFRKRHRRISPLHRPDSPGRRTEPSVQSAASPAPRVL